MVMVPTLEMSAKLETIVKISATIMENCKSVELPDEKMICASNCEDNTFDDTATVPGEKRVMTCANKCEDSSFQIEASPDICNRIMPSNDSNEDVEVDIVEDMKPDEDKVAKRNGDVTESSSSFGYTDSGIGGAAVSSDIEVESQPQDVHASLLKFDGFKTRKKKLTSRWRKFIRPLMWRSKWVELQLRELHSQVSKYDRELEECDRKKQSELEKCAAEDVGVKAAPLICQNRSVKLMKRRKRKRVEDTVDWASYTSSHSLFSYYARKRPFAGSAYVDDDHGYKDVDPAKKTPFGSDEFGLPGGWADFEFKDSDAFESILRKIDEAQLQVHQLRIRVDKVVREHAGKFTADGSSFVPVLASCVPNLVLPNVNTEKVPVPPISQHDQVTTHPDMAETTDEVRIGGRCDMTGNDVLIYDQPLKEEFDNTKEVRIQRAESPPLATEGNAGNNEIAPDPNSASQMSVTREQSTMKTRSIAKLISPKNKRKRGRRKARSSRWSRRSSG